MRPAGGQHRLAGVESGVEPCNDHIGERRGALGLLDADTCGVVVGGQDLDLGVRRVACGQQHRVVPPRCHLQPQVLFAGDAHGLGAHDQRSTRPGGLDAAHPAGFGVVAKGLGKRESVNPILHYLHEGGPVNRGDHLHCFPSGPRHCERRFTCRRVGVHPEGASVLDHIHDTVAGRVEGVFGGRRRALDALVDRVHDRLGDDFSCVGHSVKDVVADLFYFRADNGDPLGEI